MYFYFFDRYYGHDRVAQAQLEGVWPWDFFEARGYGYVLCLGESVSWVEQYTKYIDIALSEAEIFLVCSHVLSDATLSLIHRFTHQRSCSYKKTMPLWIWDPEELAKRKPETKKRKEKKEGVEQQLVIYPNLRSLSNDASLDLSQQWVMMLHSQSTKKQKSEAFWSIRDGSTKKLVCTYSQMLQEWNHLTSITIHDEHTRYYKSQQDPRYHAVEVTKKMAEVYTSDLKMTWYSLET